MPVAVRLTGRLDVRALGAALSDVVRRHDSLRTTFATTDGVPRQVVKPIETADLAWDVVDAIGWTDAGLRAAMTDVAHHIFELEVEIAIRAVIFQIADDEHVLVTVVHHIAADGCSIAPLVRVLGMAYADR